MLLEMRRTDLLARSASPATVLGQLTRPPRVRKSTCTSGLRPPVRGLRASWAVIFLVFTIGGLYLGSA